MTRTLLTALFLTLFSQTAWADGESNWDVRLECFNSTDETKQKLHFDTNTRLVKFIGSTGKYNVLTQNELVVPEKMPSFFGEFKDLETHFWSWNDHKVLSADDDLIVIENFIFDTEKLMVVQVAYYYHNPDHTSVVKFRCVNPLRLN